MKIISILILLTNLSQAMAETITCSIKTLDSVCGSGEISLQLDLTKESFQLRDGDIRCWGGDKLHSGKLLINDKTKRGYNSSTFSLIANKKFQFNFKETGKGITPIEIAEIEYSTHQDSDETKIVYLKFIGYHYPSRVMATYLMCK